jgi:UDP-GlcNAc:undecaprenyl-phosphate GlcNAc-1-phosphate transferase
VLAALAIKLRFPGQPVSVTWMVPVLVLLVPLFDLLLVVVSRSRRRVNPFTTGGTDHLSHRLVDAGLSHREAALLVYLAACATGGLAFFASLASPAQAWLTLAAVAMFGAWALWRLEFAPGAPTRIRR